MAEDGRYLLALVERSLEFLLMLTLVSFFLGRLLERSRSMCWLLEEEEVDEEELALESSSDIAS